MSANGFTGVRRLANMAMLARELDVTLGQVDTWHARRARNGFPECLGHGEVGEGRARRTKARLWDADAVLEWHKNYVPGHGGAGEHRRRDVTPEETEYLVRNGSMSADTVAMEMQDAIPVNRTKAIVRRALEALVANGLIKVVPADQWPDYYVPDPPYSMSLPK